MGFVDIQGCSSSWGGENSRHGPATRPKLAGKAEMAWAGAPGPALSGGYVQLTGRWYSIGLASSSNWFKDKKHLMKMCTTVITVTADGNLEVNSTYPKYERAAGEHGGSSGHSLLPG